MIHGWVLSGGDGFSTARRRIRGGCEISMLHSKGNNNNHLWLHRTLLTRDSGSSPCPKFLRCFSALLFTHRTPGNISIMAR